MVNEAESAQTTKFDRSLNLFDATAIIITCMIGSGIFIVSSQMASELHSLILVIICWFAAGAMAVIGALCYGKMATCWPQVGGQYIYLKHTWGPVIAFLYGWTLFLVINTGSIAAVAIAFAKFLGIILPNVSSAKPIFQFYSVSFSSQTVIALLVILAVMGLNLQGVKLVSRIQNLVTVSNVLALSLIIVLGLFIGFNPVAFQSNFMNQPPLPFSGVELILAMAMAFVGPLFALDGWQNVGFIAAEIKEPQKKLPVALFLGSSIVATLYALVNVVYAFVLSLPDIQHAKNGLVGATFMHSILGPWGENLIAYIILIATFGCVNSMLLAGSRLLYVMAKDGHFFSHIGTLGKRSKVPEIAIVYQSAWSMILVLSGSYSNLLDYMVVASVIFYFLTVGGLFRIPKLHPELTSKIRWWGHPVLPILFCLLCVLILLSLLVYRPFYALMAVLIVLTGIPVYYFWRNGQSLPEDDDTIPAVDGKL